ncbi:MAG: helix-turn-helix domain-containing protein [Alphaproteobacteria bacterium]|nr:helix-turn-helix domain-containing protein [Alphaproteobacteria bacterium]
MRTRDLNEAIEAVSKVYCPHSVEVMGRERNIDVRLKVKHPTFQPVVELSYDARVKIDAKNFSRLFLMMHCARGAASTMQEKRTAEWRQGQTMPFSADVETRLWFDASFVQESVRLDMEKLEVQCARWLGRPLDRLVRFALHPFSEDLEQAWRRTLTYLRSNEGSRLAFSPAAKAAFDEFLLTLLLHQHPHNFSEEMARSVPTPVPGLVRRAERFMSDNAEAPITVSDVADHLGVSLRSLQAGFRAWRNATPSSVLRNVRFQRIRDELLRPTGENTVTTVAMRYGFSHLGRFSSQYQRAFGEAPSVTLRRGRYSKRG